MVKIYTVIVRYGKGAGDVLESKIGYSSGSECSGKGKYGVGRLFLSSVSLILGKDMAHQMQ